MLTKTLQVAEKTGVEYVVYSTCSVNDEENEQVVEHCMGLVDGFKLLNIIPQLPKRGLRHPEVIRNGVEGDEGFFVALFGKK